MLSFYPSKAKPQAQPLFNTSGGGKRGWRRTQPKG